MYCAELLQSCLTLCNPSHHSPPDFSVHGILQASILQWVAISFFRRSSRPRDRTQASYMAGRFFTVWPTKEAHLDIYWKLKQRKPKQNPHIMNECVLTMLWLSSWNHLWRFSHGQDFPGGSEGKASAYSVGDPGSIPGSGRSPEEGNGNPLQYSCLENPIDGGAWWAAVHGVTKSRTLSDFTFTFHFQC